MTPAPTDAAPSTIKEFIGTRVSFGHLNRIVARNLTLMHMLTFVDLNLHNRALLTLT